MGFLSSPELCHAGGTTLYAAAGGLSASVEVHLSSAKLEHSGTHKGSFDSKGCVILTQLWVEVLKKRRGTIRSDSAGSALWSADLQVPAESRAMKMRESVEVRKLYIGERKTGNGQRKTKNRIRSDSVGFGRIRSDSVGFGRNSPRCGMWEEDTTNQGFYLKNLPCNTAALAMLEGFLLPKVF